MPTLANWPAWLGGIPSLGLFIVVLGYILIQILKNQPVLHKQRVDERFRVEEGDRNRIKDLTRQIEACRAECRVRDKEIDNLKNQINNEAWQRVQSEISLVRTLIDIVDAPQMKIILGALQTKQALMVKPVELDGVVGDAQKQP